MKKMAIALLLLGSFAGVAAAQTPIWIYGTTGADYSFGEGNNTLLGVNPLSDRPSLLGAQSLNPFSLGYIYTPLLGAQALSAYRNANDRSDSPLSRNTMFSGAYTFSSGLKFSGSYQTNRNDFLLDSRDTRDWMLGASMPFDANTFMASYIRHINKTVGNADASQFSLGYAYTVSKQTLFYTSVSRFSNDSGMRFHTPGDSENMFNAGIRHRF
jgi:predicted porin